MASPKHDRETTLCLFPKFTRKHKQEKKCNHGNLLMGCEEPIIGLLKKTPDIRSIIFDEHGLVLRRVSMWFFLNTRDHIAMNIPYSLKNMAATKKHPALNSFDAVLPQILMIDTYRKVDRLA